MRADPGDFQDAHAAGGGLKMRALLGASILATALLAGCASAPPKFEARGEVAGVRVETTVDTPIARYYLERYLKGERSDPALDARIHAIHRRFARAIPTRDDLAAISRETSIDFAALFLAQRLLADDCNRWINAEFARELERPAPVENASRFTVLFAPGWDYIALGKITGADFALARSLAAQHGFEVEMAAFQPNGSIEGNARIFAADVARLARAGRRIIVSSASTAGPSVQVALAELVPAEERAAIAGWLSIGGLLQGSPIVEYLLEWPQRAIFEGGVLWKGWERDAIIELGTTRGRQRFERLRLDPALRIVNYVSVPLSGQVGPHARSNYPVLAREGPNDGLTLLADAIVPGSLTIVALGSDHFIADDPRIKEKAAALMRLMVRVAQGDPRSHCIPPR
jgi:hypothetical protein